MASKDPLYKLKKDIEDKYKRATEIRELILKGKPCECKNCTCKDDNKKRLDKGDTN